MELRCMKKKAYFLRAVEGLAVEELLEILKELVSKQEQMKFVGGSQRQSSP